MNITANILSKELDKMPSELQKATYESIMKTYDRVENILAGMEKFGDEAEPYIKHLQKLVDVIEKNNEIIIDNFFKYMESGKALSGVEKLKIEKALEMITMSIRDFTAKIN